MPSASEELRRLIAEQVAAQAIVDDQEQELLKLQHRMLAHVEMMKTAMQRLEGIKARRTRLFADMAKGAETAKCAEDDPVRVS